MVTLPIYMFSSPESFLTVLFVVFNSLEGKRPSVFYDVSRSCCTFTMLITFSSRSSRPTTNYLLLSTPSDCLSPILEVFFLKAVLSSNFELCFLARQEGELNFVQLLSMSFLQIVDITWRKSIL